MRVIAIKTLNQYWVCEPASKGELLAWYAEVKASDWSSPSDVKEKYRNASILKDCRVVFNICGNKYRLVVRINYLSKIIYIRFIGTHNEYDAIDAGIV